jgi:hypothetical protein
MTLETYYQKKSVEVLQGKTIMDVRYATQEEANKKGWANRGIVMALSDGTIITILSDNFGTNMGAIDFYREEHYCGVLETFK